MQEIRLTVRCANQPNKHAKVLRLDAELGKEFAQGLADLLDGSSSLYIYKPGANSPIGKCCTCGGQLSATVEETEAEDAQPA